MWIFRLILSFGMLSIIWGTISVIKAKNKVLVIKEQINIILDPIAQFIWIHILTVFIVLTIGVELLKQRSLDVFMQNFANGFEVGILILLLELNVLWIYDEYNSYKKKTQSVFTKWIKYIEVNGVIRYTEAEKAIRKTEHDKFILKMRNKFPKIAQWHDKRCKVV